MAKWPQCNRCDEDANAPMAAYDILLVDDEKDICALMADVLQDEGYTTRQVHSSDTALAALAERVPAAVFLDIWLQGSELDGLGILEIIRERYPDVPVIMISGHGNVEAAVGAMKLGAYDFIQKPFEEDELLLTLKRALEIARLKRENAELRLRSGVHAELVGQSVPMQQLRQAIAKVAPTNSRVFITGASGTGKELVARIIHQQSRRAEGPFVVLSAHSMAPEKIEQELFGVENTQNMLGGASKLGVLERAHGGTLYIDEVADMPLETQAKILRVLQEQRFERMGGGQPVTVDVRIIVATSRDMMAEIAIGSFRQELYYRLNVVPLKVPSLAERREDIASLCAFFLKRFAESAGLPNRTLSDEVVAILESYRWPGNVRELRNLIERLMILAPGQAKEPIGITMLPPEYTAATPHAHMPSLSEDIMSLPLKEARELFERQYLQAQINRFGGNISKTSSFIGMERSALHRKLKSLEVANSNSRLREALAAEEV